MKPAPSASSAGVAAWVDAKPPLLRFLDRCHTDFKTETGGALANYIPELGKADPDHFGISLATLDGHVYEVGDTTIPFTIQSMSSPSCSRWHWIRSAQSTWKARSASNHPAIPSIRSDSIPKTT